MRLLNDTEKDFCKRILAGDGANNFLGNIIDHRLGGVRISITKNPKRVKLLFSVRNQQPTAEESDNLPLRNNEVTTDILTAVNLIKLLEKENYIMLFNRATVSQNQMQFGQGFANTPYVESEIKDDVVSDLLIEYVEKEIFVTEEFREFCKNNYISREELRHRKEMNITRSALIVAIIALVINTVFSFIPRKSEKITINQEQMCPLMESLTTISDKLDKLKTTDKDFFADKNETDETKKACH